jgi:hypothetical protein
MVSLLKSHKAKCFVKDNGILCFIIFIVFMTSIKNQIFTVLVIKGKFPKFAWLTSKVLSGARMLNLCCNHF